MPINITRTTDTQSERVSYLCDDDWQLPRQLAALEQWLNEAGRALTPSSYVADIGFDIRPDACGGGGVLSVASMRIMVELGMELLLSEYPDGAA